MQALKGEALRYTEVQGMDNELLYDLFRVALLIKKKVLVGMLIKVMGGREWFGWSEGMVAKLMVLAMEQGNEYALQTLFAIPVAEHITGQLYNNLLVLLLSHPDRFCRHVTAKYIIQRVRWDDLLVEQISAAVDSQVTSSFSGYRYGCGYLCSICRVLQQICRSCAATLPMQLKTSLLRAATSSHKHAATTLLRRVARYEGIMEAADGRIAVAAALRSWPVEPTLKYRRYFKELLRQPAVQQLPLGEVQQLLQQAAGSNCAEGLQCLLKALPAAEEVTVEGYYQLLELAICSRDFRVRGYNCHKQEVVAVLVRCNLSARVPPGAAQLQQLLLRCIEDDQSLVIKYLLGGFKEAAQQLAPAAVYEMLQQAAHRAVDCFSVLLDLVPQLEEVPLEVLQKLLPVLMNHSCPRVKLTPQTVHGSLHDAVSCSTCSVLKAAGGKLAAADVWEVLVAAAKAQVQSIHYEGLAHLPGVDDLADDQVEQLLLAAIEGWKVPFIRKGWHGHRLVWRIEQLQGELLLGRRLPSAAVHRLIMACMETAGSWCLGELREELGLPREGWEGPLSQQQLEQLLQAALARERDSAYMMEAIECVVVLARLLPSVKERQQVGDMLRAPRLQMVGKEHDCVSQEQQLAHSSGSDLGSDSESDSGAGSQPDLDADSEVDSEADYEFESDADSDL
jgi:hypothetical protein